MKLFLWMLELLLITLGDHFILRDAANRLSNLLNTRLFSKLQRKFGFSDLGS